MLRMKYLVTLTLVVLCVALTSSMAFAQWIQIEYLTPLAPTSVPVATEWTEATFSDVPSTGLGDDEDEAFWAWAEIEECAATHTEAEDFIVQGYGDDSYQPGLVVTRGMMAVFIARAGGYTSDVTEVSFVDVPDTYWAYEEIERCVSAGVVKGYADYFGEDDPETTEIVEGGDAYLPTVMVDRSQMAVYISRAAGLTTAAYAGTFDDVADDWWAALEIEACADEDIVQGYGGGIYLPENLVTRAQMGVFVWRGLVRGTDETYVAGADVVCGYGATADITVSGGQGTAELFYADDHSLTDAASADLDEDVVVYVALDGAQVGDGTITFEVVDSEDAVVGTDFVDVVGQDSRDAIDLDDNGLNPYTIAAYQVDTGLDPDTYTVTAELPNGAVITIGEFEVE